MFNTKLLMSDAKNFAIDAAINPYYGAENLDENLAEQEHATIRHALEQAGAEIIQVASPADAQDGVYTANWALTRGKKAVLARLPNVRKIEENYAKNVLENLGFKVFLVPENWKFSGQGDALPCGNLLFCGSGYRSDESAQEFVAKTLGFERIQLRTIPAKNADGTEKINAISGWADSFFYDLDLALSILRPPKNGEKGLIAYCPEAFTEDSRKILENLDAVEKITIDFREATEGFACNLVSTGEKIVMSAQAPKFAAELKKRGFTLIQPEIAELKKGGGYIRCVSLALDNQ